MGDMGSVPRRRKSVVRDLLHIGGQYAGRSNPQRRCSQKHVMKSDCDKRACALVEINADLNAFARR